MINKCNAKLNVGSGIHQDHMVLGSASFTLITNFRHTAVLKKNRFKFDKKAYAAVQIDVKCVGVAKPKPKPPVAIGPLKNNLKPTHGATKNLRPKAKRTPTIIITPAPKTAPIGKKSMAPAQKQAPKARILTRSSTKTRKLLVR